MAGFALVNQRPGQSPQFGAVRPLFGSEDTAKETKAAPSHPNADDVFARGNEVNSAEVDAPKPDQQDAFAAHSNAQTEEAPEIQGPHQASETKETQPSEESSKLQTEESQPIQKKGKAFWAKSALVSCMSWLLLAASLLIPGGIFVRAGVAGAAYLLNDYLKNISRKNSLFNITDSESLKDFILEKARGPLEIAARFRHPFRAQKQAKFVEKKLSHIHTNQFDLQQKHLAHTGIDFQSFMDEIKGETS